MRKLASIQKIKKILPVKNADRLELAQVLGWQVVVKKDEFREGDLVVYFEIDSFLPAKECFSFLKDSSYKKSELLGEGYRLKTIKLRGEISQGLIMPLSLAKEAGCTDLKEGDDITEALGVKKWEEPMRASTGGTITGGLPYSISKTDETRIQAEPRLLDEFKDAEYYISTKMDGSSHSISFDKDGLHVCGHNYEYADDGKSSFYEFLKRNEIIARFLAFVKKTKENEEGAKEMFSLTLQGELCAPGIQKNPLKLTEPHWYVFSVCKNEKRLGLDELLNICKEIGLETVPIEERGRDLKEQYKDIDALLKRAEGQYPPGGPKEGIVIRTTTPAYSDILNDNLSFKVINNKYLLKRGD